MNADIMYEAREVKVKLPKDLVDWLEEIARARGETVDEVLTWTLGNLRNFYDRWLHARKRLLDTRLNEYKEYLASRGLKTRNDYYSVARRFVEWLKNKNLYDIDDITCETIESYLGELNVKTSTKSLYRYYLKDFLNFIKSGARH